MYQQTNSHQLEFLDFYLPFSGHLDLENRWILLARLVPWQLVDQVYHDDLCEDFGAPIVSSRTAMASLIIKERRGLTDRETVDAIQENPYLQFFIGGEEFTQEPPFHASLMVDFRKRFGEEGIKKIGEAIALAVLEQESFSEEYSKSNDDNSPPSSQPTTNDSSDHTDNDTDNDTTNHTPTESSANQGELIADATCAPSDIRYPTDVSLLNEAREKTEEIIDELHTPRIGKVDRPRTYRRKSRHKFLTFIHKKRPGGKAIRRAKREQLAYIRRNFRAIDELLQDPQAMPLARLSRRLYKNLFVCREVYRQQFEMFASHTNRIDDRIVSISQPHVRLIKRGKSGRDVEFGAKLSISVVRGFSFLSRLSWDNYNESADLIEQIETYRKQFGFYPASVHVDKIYRTRKNRAYCKTRGIRMSGPKLGRPPENVSAEEQQQTRADEGIRNQVEGKFGEGKRRYSLGLIMTKLAETSAAQISLIFLVMNLERALRRLFFSFLFYYPHRFRPAPRSNPR